MQDALCTLHALRGKVRRPISKLGGLNQLNGCLCSVGTYLGIDDVMGWMDECLYGSDVCGRPGR